MNVLRATLTGAAFFILIVLLSSCQRKTVSFDIPQFDTAMEPANDSTRVHFYFDATCSMRGFVNSGDASIYCKLVKMLEAVALESWPRGARSYWKFGSRVVPISRDEQLDVYRPSFYSDPEVMLTTRIDSVIFHSVSQDLTLIVTDLFEQDADIVNIVRIMKDKYLLQGFAVALLGVRSQYDGEVYDIGPNARHEAYRNIPDRPQTYRPFYVLMLGRHADIEHYYKNLQIHDRGMVRDETFTIFSRFHLRKQVTFACGKEIGKHVGLAPDVTIATLPGMPPQLVKQYRLQREEDNCEQNYQFAHSVLPYTLPYTRDSYECSVSGEYALANKPEAKGQLSSTQIEDAILFTNNVVSDSLLNVSFTLRPGRLPYRDAVYCLRISLTAPSDYFSLPGWISDWDMNSKGTSDGAVSSKGNELIGTTTYNLLSFSTTLMRTMLQIESPKTGELLLVIKR